MEAGMEEEQQADGALVERMARGDRTALGELYQRHSRRLLAIAHPILGDPTETADLIHDVFLEVWRRAEDYDPSRGSVGSWLSLRVRSRAIDRLRAAPRGRTIELTAELSAGLSDPSSALARTVDRAKLTQALQSLTVDEQEVIIRGYFEGLSSTEIGEQLGIPVGTVKSRTRSALEKLRAALAEKRDVP